MKTTRLAGLALVPALFLGGCSLQGVTDTISSAQVCAQSAVILTDMRDMLGSAAVNPLAIQTYGAELQTLVDEFGALEPTDPELATAHADVTASLGAILETVENPSVKAIAGLPTQVAETEIALRDFASACSLPQG